VIARSQNVSELARRIGVSRDGLYKALSEGGNHTCHLSLDGLARRDDDLGLEDAPSRRRARAA
jgi:hypothetical protein